MGRLCGTEKVWPKKSACRPAIREACNLVIIFLMLRSNILRRCTSHSPLLPLFCEESSPSCSSLPTWNQWQQHQQRRCISEEQINADGATVAELFEQSLSKASRKRPTGEEGDGGPTRLLTTRREALHLYREIMRYSNLFVWKDEKGNVWRDILRSGNATGCIEESLATAMQVMDDGHALRPSIKLMIFVLRANARKEYDSAREEIDPEIINKVRNHHQ